MNKTNNLINRQEKFDIQSNTLLYTENLYSDWKRFLNEDLLNAVKSDFKQCGYNLVPVSGNTSWWDATAYLNNEHSACSLTIKAKSVLTFVFAGGIALINCVRCKDAFLVCRELHKVNGMTVDVEVQISDLGVRLNNGEQVVVS